MIRSIMSNLKVLRTYAQKAPESLPCSILFKHSSKNITIFDAYPKSMFHFLILPRIQKPDSALVNLGSLLSGDKVRAKEVIDSLWEDAQVVKKEISDEMVSRYGFKWDIWIGFHGAPSMEHLHLHVLSADLLSEKMKNKKHYNSFHPKLGFFLHMEEILEWLDAEATFFANTVKALKPTKYEPILKESLVCFHCNTEMKNIPLLKKHLEEEWDKLERQAREDAGRKRKAEPSQNKSEDEHKKLKTS